MPSTPSRGYTYPTTSSPATVPADLRVPLEQVDADVQTVVDQLEGTVRLNEDGSLPEAVEERVEQIAVAFGSPAGAIPIFPSLAEAEAWELANPGRTALTLEPQTPDVTPPVPGALHVIPAHDSATLSVDGASDDRGITGYSFRRDGGVWSEWQGEPEHTMEGLAPATGYSFQHRVRDRAGNETVGAAVSATTSETPPTSPEDIGSLLASWDMTDAVVAGGVITSVPDSAGTRALVAADAGPVPVSEGGKQLAVFTAASATRLRWAGGVWGVEAPFSICVIARAGATDGTLVGTTNTFINIGGAGLVARYVGSGTAGVPVSATDLVLVTAVFTTTDVTLHVGSESSQRALSVVDLGSNIALGAIPNGTGSAHTDATIGRAWVHGRALTSGEHASLTEWARAEWGTL